MLGLQGYASRTVSTAGCCACMAALNFLLSQYFIATLSMRGSGSAKGS